MRTVFLVLAAIALLLVATQADELDESASSLGLGEGRKRRTYKRKNYKPIKEGSRSWMGVESATYLEEKPDSNAN